MNWICAGEYVPCLATSSVPLSRFSPVGRSFEALCLWPHFLSSICQICTLVDVARLFRWSFLPPKYCQLLKWLQFSEVTTPGLDVRLFFHGVQPVCYVVYRSVSVVGLDSSCDSFYYFIWLGRKIQVRLFVISGLAPIRKVKRLIWRYSWRCSVHCSKDRTLFLFIQGFWIFLLAYNVSFLGVPRCAFQVQWRAHLPNSKAIKPIGSVGLEDSRRRSHTFVSC